MCICLSVGLSVRHLFSLHAHNSRSTGPIWMKFGLWDFCVNISRGFFHFLNISFFKGYHYIAKNYKCKFLRNGAYDVFYFLLIEYVLNDEHTGI